MPTVQQRTFWVADLNSRGELQLKAPYRYAQLEQLPDAADLIVHLATLVWRSPDEFETDVPGTRRTVRLRWISPANGCGIATLRVEGELASISFLVSGKSEPAERLTLQAFQHHLLAELRDTGFEPSFALLEIAERPLVATINFCLPDLTADQRLVALADRCVGAAFFRTLDLA